MNVHHTPSFPCPSCGLCLWKDQLSHDPAAGPLAGWKKRVVCVGCEAPRPEGGVPKAAPLLAEDYWEDCLPLGRDPAEEARQGEDPPQRKRKGRRK